MNDIVLKTKKCKPMEGYKLIGDFSICIICKSTYIVNSPNQKYCCETCLKLARNPLEKVRVCKYCGEKFISRLKNSRYANFCSEKCRIDREKQRHRDKNKLFTIRCSECEKEFIGYRNKKTCSNECKNKRIVKLKIEAYPIGHKKCPACKSILPYDCFNKSAKSLVGYGSYCKECQKIKHLENPRTDKRREYKQKVRDRLRLETGTCVSDAERTRRRIYEAKRRETDVKFNLNNRMRCRMWQSLRKRNLNKNNTSWFDITGYTIEDLCVHLESKFVDGMGWDNIKLWHVDHIVPIASFNYTSIHDEEFKKCWALSNLQPLWGPDNLMKGCKY